MGISLLAAFCLAGSALPGVAPSSSGPAWTARNVEHLLNRAGWGATPAEIAAALEQTPEEFVDSLLAPREPYEHVDPVLIRWEDFDLDPRAVPVPRAQSKYKGMSRREANKIMSDLRRVDHTQFMDYIDAYFDSILEARDPLGDHMALFWHGFFTTASPVVKRKFELIEQHQFLRDHALGNYKDLLHGIVRDPGMLQYLDNNTNVKGHPNENLARELMELFSLGEGHYTEVDVREAARALTGDHANPEGRFEFQPDLHDDGEKTILGVTGKLTGKDLVDVLLAQKSCPRWVIFRLLKYFEGVEPSEERLAAYAKLLRDEDYELRPVLRHLFLDPEFYRDEVIAARVQSPIEFVVGLCRRLGVRPASYVMLRLTTELGEGLYQPPSVKGWEGGETWVTNGLLLARGNTAGVLLGTLPDDDDVANAGDPADMMAEMGEMGDGMVDETMARDAALQDEARASLVGDLNALAKVSHWDRDLDVAGTLAVAPDASDEEIVATLLDAWLAIEPPAHLNGLLLEHIAREREELDLGSKPLMQCPEAEGLLRRLAHLIYSLPEAQLG